ncbi:MAG: hypothetical protein SD837_12035 [Candidatus Electrothrix scaldis]|nr:MAG: hypothetical protein SD837_12035 [Candidatus Electrothrix sp. GW3-3]
MMEDPIVKETRKIREQIASEHKYDVYKLGRYFMRKQQVGQRVFVTIPPEIVKRRSVLTP